MATTKFTIVGAGRPASTSQFSNCGPLVCADLRFDGRSLADRASCVPIILSVIYNPDLRSRSRRAQECDSATWLMDSKDKRLTPSQVGAEYWPKQREDGGVKKYGKGDCGRSHRTPIRGGKCAVYASLRQIRQTSCSRSIDRDTHSPVRHVQQVQASTACNQKGLVPCLTSP